MGKRERASVSLRNIIFSLPYTLNRKMNCLPLLTNYTAYTRTRSASAELVTFRSFKKGKRRLTGIDWSLFSLYLIFSFCLPSPNRRRKIKKEENFEMCVAWGEGSEAVTEHFFRFQIILSLVLNIDSRFDQRCVRTRECQTLIRRFFICFTCWSCFCYGFCFWLCYVCLDGILCVEMRSRCSRFSRPEEGNGWEFVVYTSHFHTVEEEEKINQM